LIQLMIADEWGRAGDRLGPAADIVADSDVGPEAGVTEGTGAGAPRWLPAREQPTVPNTVRNIRTATNDFDPGDRRLYPLTMRITPLARTWKVSPTTLLCVRRRFEQINDKADRDSGWS
jgi:hypothetical protein